MADAARIREVFDRNVKVLTRSPGKGRLTGVTTARCDDGLACVVEEGPWRLSVDMPANLGGTDTGPPPGVLGRGALASCIAIGVRMWAARLEVPIGALEVEIQADFDARGELGIDDVESGYQEVRYIVSIDSPAPEAALVELLEMVERYSPYVDVFRRAQPMKAQLRHNRTEA